MKIIHWFRRDLRITDNRALAEAARRGDEIIPVYVLSDWKKSHRWSGPARQQFLCDCLAALDANLRTLGSRLIIRCGDAERELEKLIAGCAADALTFNRDPDLFGIASERRIERMAARHGCTVHACKDVALHERDEVLKPDGSPYRVFTPYFKAWQKLDKQSPAGRLRRLATPRDIESLDLPTLDHWQLPAAPPGILEGGEKAARNRLQRFLDGGIGRYGAQRNTPYGQTTSRLSQDLRFGLLSIREVYAKCRKAMAGASADARKSIHQFISELCWREFYFQILWHFPEVLEREFNPQFRALEWDYDEQAFAAWREGRTGFPIVDAAMRELAQTGYMHNRTRMIVSMFLTKDLHIDWRLGEQFFMQSLVDGEIGSNNGGWQWSAGTGADAAPYFRIQNPWTQCARHDPEGRYVKRFVPELAAVDPRRFREPPADGRPLAAGYPLPIVDHARERERTLEMFSRCKEDIAPRDI